MKLLLENWRKYLGEQEDISPVTNKPYPRNLSPEKKKEYDDWASNKTFDPTAVATGGDTPLQKAAANKKAAVAQAGDVAQLKTVGDLRKALAVATRLKKSQAGKEAVKGTAMGLALGALGEIPGFSLAAAGAGAAKDIAGLVKSVYQLPDDKETNTALDALNVDDEISAMLDNKVENMFLNWLSKAIAEESDEKPLAALNMDRLLQKFLMQKFDQRTITSPELKEMKISQQQLHNIILEEVILHLHEQGLLGEGFMDDFKKKAGKVGAGLALGGALMGVAGPAQAGPKWRHKQKRPEPVAQQQQQQQQNSLKDLLGGVVNRNADGDATSLTVAVKLGRSSSLAQSEVSLKLDRLAQKEGINAQGAKSVEIQMLDGIPHMVATQQIAAP